ncbi:2-amino-4-hydroxy-6-hydroxymethyldihydropteridine diphosphokinase [Desulfobaculum xiamenense]|uniref:2-amino-4-hydroxy-6-hydroxymethyldihydropteridine pyrophosphokinase n=1 Tax=Desulfobaculum xiamenense TaxID=995050 RepID=A0A846QN25_9BACT|nr:2-amino-4-hydroxy-6-hydroxymethyldihydropteridine diphosphokinase [Desulfobaculum xiamenense]
MTVDAVSAVYFTEPQDVKNQPWFANRVARVLCEGKISPQGLLDELLRVEAELGRVRGEGVVRFGPRVIDLDLLLYGDAVMETETLTLPHPRMRQRAFVLVPLADVAPDLRFPDGDTLRDALARLSYRVDNFRIWQD